MEFNRQEIKANARAALKASYWPIVGITILADIIIAALAMLGAIPVVGLVASVLISPIIEVGLLIFNLEVYMGEKPEIGTLFKGFKDGRFGHVLGGFWYMQLFTFLWSLLFIIPGIVKSIAYSMTPYILVDQPEISATDALKKSMEMTKGHKWEIFVFMLSYLGWDILSAITCGIVGIFYVIPYEGIALAGIYDVLKRMSGDDVVATASATEEIEKAVEFTEE